MSKFVQIFLTIFYYVVVSVTAKGPYRWFALNKEVSRYDGIASCVNSTARRLFDSGNRLVVICAERGPLENEIARLLMKEETVITASKPLNLTNERARSYVIVETKNPANLRKNLLGESRQFSRSSEYLIVLGTNDEIIRGLSRDMWQFGYRYFAFLLFKDPEHIEIGLPGADGTDKFALQVKEACATNGKKDSLTPFSRQLCLFKKCVLRYGGITDETVLFWRGEDKLRVPGIGKRFVEVFGNLYNIAIDTNVSRNLNWSEATRLLTENEVDIVNGRPPDNIQEYKGLQILCWYMSRSMVFAGLIEQRNVNEMLQFLTPFHYSVWICVACLSIFYLTLLYFLKRLWLAGLISEYIRFTQVCQIALAQGVNFPKKTGLRIVLGLWMIFSLYLSIIYDSTFTSSLARVHDEITLTSLEEVRNTNLSIGGPKVMATYLNDSNDEIMSDLYKRYRIMSAEDAMEELIYNDTMVVLQVSTVDSLNWIHRANKSLKIYSLPYPVLQFPAMFFSKKGHPYSRFFETTVARTYETGFWEKWYKISLIDEDKGFAEEPADAGILKMTQLRSVFHLYLFCISISLFIFVLELFYYNLSRNVRRLTSTTKACHLREKTLTRRRR